MRTGEVSETILPNDYPNLASKFPKNGVLGNYDPIQSELDDKPTFRALMELFLGLPVDREEMVRRTASGMEGFQTTFDLVGWLKTKADCDMAFLLDSSGRSRVLL